MALTVMTTASAGPEVDPRTFVSALRAALGRMLPGYRIEINVTIQDEPGVSRRISLTEAKMRSGRAREQAINR